LHLKQDFKEPELDCSASTIIVSLATSSPLLIVLFFLVAGYSSSESLNGLTYFDFLDSVFLVFLLFSLSSKRALLSASVIHSACDLVNFSFFQQ
jgi:hypothetical protein